MVVAVAMVDGATVLLEVAGPETALTAGVAETTGVEDVPETGMTTIAEVVAKDVVAEDTAPVEAGVEMANRLPVTAELEVLAALLSAAADVAAAATAAAVADTVLTDVSRLAPVVEYMERGDEW